MKSPKSPLYRGIAKLVSGAGAAQLVALLAYPVLSRIYDDRAFGVLAAYISIVNIVSTVSRLQYAKAVPLPKSNQRAFDLVVLCVYLNILGALAFLVVVFAFPEALSPELSGSYSGALLVLVPIGIILAGLYSSLSLWAVRFREYGVLATTKVSRNIGVSGFQLAFGFIQAHPLGLVAGQMLGSGVGITAIATRTIRGRGLRYPRLRSVLAAGKSYWRFAVLGGPSAIFNTLAGNLPALLITSFYSVPVAGQFGIAMRVIGAPLELLGASIENAFYGEASALGRKGANKVKQMADRLTIRLAAGAIIPSLVLLLWGPELFTWVFGVGWYDAGVFARYLTVFMFFNLLAVPFSSVFMIFDRLGLYMLLSSLKVVAATLSFTVPHFLGATAPLSMLVYSLSMGMFYIVFGVAARIILSKEARSTAI